MAEIVLAGALIGLQVLFEQRSSSSQHVQLFLVIGYMIVDVTGAFTRSRWQSLVAMALLCCLIAIAWRVDIHMAVYVA